MMLAELIGRRHAHVRDKNHLSIRTDAWCLPAVGSSSGGAARRASARPARDRATLGVRHRVLSAVSRERSALHVGMLWTELGRRRHAGLVGRLRERERELAAVEVLLERRGRV